MPLMYVTRLVTEGLRHAPSELDDLDRVVDLPDPPARQAVADGLLLLAAGLAPARAHAVLQHLGWGGEVVPEDDDGELQVRELRAAAVRAAVADEHRAVTVDARLHLDPPLYGRLRGHAARDPRVVTALGQDPSLSVRVGWLFNGDRTAVVPSLLGVRVGEVAFDTTGRDRPVWLPELVRELGSRVAATDPFEPVTAVSAQLRAALLSPDAAVRAGYATWQHTLAADPFALPEPGIVEVHGTAELVFGPELLRVRQLGPRAVSAARVVQAAVIGRPDVLVVPEALDAHVVAWLRALPSTADAPVEQVWVCP